MNTDKQLWPAARLRTAEAARTASDGPFVGLLGQGCPGTCPGTSLGQAALKGKAMHDTSSGGQGKHSSPCRSTERLRKQRGRRLLTQRQGLRVSAAHLRVPRPAGKPREGCGLREQRPGEALGPRRLLRPRNSDLPFRPGCQRSLGRRCGEGTQERGVSYSQQNTARSCRAGFAR